MVHFLLKNSSAINQLLFNGKQHWQTAMMQQSLGMSRGKTTYKFVFLGEIFLNFLVQKLQNFCNIDKCFYNIKQQHSSTFIITELCSLNAVNTLWKLKKVSYLNNSSLHLWLDFRLTSLITGNEVTQVCTSLISITKQISFKWHSL